MSQDELAEAIFVSRQTISNWETDKTYPDIQSLLLLCEVLHTSADELIQGDIAVMRQNMKSDSKKMHWLSWGMLVSAGLGVAFFIMLSIFWRQPSGAGNLTYGNVAGFFVFLPLYIIAMAMAVAVERIKSRNDVVAYREIEAFLDGKVGAEIERDARVFSRSHPAFGVFLKFSAGALIGAAVGFIVYKLLA